MACRAASLVARFAVASARAATCARLATSPTASRTSGGTVVPVGWS
jgi:hypothetical protein